MKVKNLCMALSACGLSACGNPEEYQLQQAEARAQVQACWAEVHRQAVPASVSATQLRYCEGLDNAFAGRYGYHPSDYDK